MWTPSSLPSDVPVYVGIADAVAADVAAGRLRPGDRLPTHRELAKALGVNVVTVTRGYGEAARRGLVDGEVGRGTFVREPVRRDVALDALEPDDRAPIDFGFNLPAGDPGRLDVDRGFAGLADGLGRAAVFSAYTALGLRSHREAGAAWVARGGLVADVDRVLVTAGAQHAMSVVLSTLTAPGDAVLTEALTYPGMKALAGVMHLRTHGIAIDGHGLRPDAFEAACKRLGARVLYVMPTVHNPTGLVMPLERREAIVDVARRHDVTIVEDDTYAFLCEDPPPPLAALAPERTVLITGTSKSIAAGLRVGYLLAPSEQRAGDVTVERLAASVAALGWMASPIGGELATRWIREGAAHEMVAWKRREVAARRRAFERRLPGLAPRSSPASGHVWLELPEPWRSEDFAERARQLGVALTPAEAFAVGRGAVPHAVRVCLATPPARRDVEKGLRVLATLLAAPPGGGAFIV